MTPDAVSLSDNEIRQDNSDGPGPNADLFTQLKKKITRGQAARAYWYKETIRAFDFVANIQWSEDDKEMLDQQHRPAVSFNRTAPIIKAICGLEVNNRQAVVYLPRQEGQSEIDESITSTGKWMRDECNAEDEESEAFRDLTICGEGWTESSMNFDESPKGQFVEERMPPLEMGVFDGATRANYKDARGIYRIREMDPDDAIDLFDGKFTARQLHASWLDPSISPQDGGVGNKTDYPDETRAAVAQGTLRDNRVRLVQVQWWQRENVHLVAQHGDTKVQEYTDAEFQTYTDRVDQIKAASPESAPIYEHAMVKQRVYYEAFLGSQIIHTEKMPIQEFKWKAMTGDRDRSNKCFYGVMRDMFDPQMWANKWLSQTMHILNTNAKGGIMAETDAFVNVAKAEKDWADNTKIIWVKPGSLVKKKVQDRTPPPLPQGLGELMQFALSSLRDVTGVNLELLGQADREQAASLEAQRRQSAMTILATLFDSLRRYRKAQGRLTLHFIQLLPTGTLTRVLDQGKWKFIPLVKSKDVECYDVIIDEAPSSPDQKMLIWSVTTQLLSQGIPFTPPTIIALLKYSPYPESVVNEIAASMGLNGQMNPQMMQQKLQQAEQALQVMTQKLQGALNAAADKTNADLEGAVKLVIEDYKAKTGRIAAELNYAGMVKKNETDLNVQAMTQLAPSPGGEDGEGQIPGIDLISAVIEKAGQLHSQVQQSPVQPPQQPLPPTTPLQ